jgi:parallel beta helix pectate lyase-like protein
MARRTPQLALMLLVAASVSISSASAKTWTVYPDGSGDVVNIQAGINAAQDGDVVLATPGIYYERLDFMGKKIHVLGSGAETTVLNAAGLDGPAVTFANGETEASILEAFTLTGGAGRLDNGSRYGAGAYILGASPTVRNNRFMNNMMVGTEASYGGGIYCASNAGAPAMPYITDNVFEENLVNTGGGAIAIGNNAAPVIAQNALRRNEASQGGALWFDGGTAAPKVLQNTFDGNLASTVGGGLYGKNGVQTVLISRNVFVSNVARGAEQNGGGAIYLELSSAVQVNGNTLIKNRVQGPDLGWGGSVVLVDCSGGAVERNLICFSSAGGAIRCTGAGLSIRNNLVWQNAGDESAGDCANWVGTDGNVSEDPELCGMDSGDFRPSSGSPALLNPAGPLGAFSDPGCGPVATKKATWGSLKSRF